MIVLRVKLLGTGADGDPYRVSLPRYRLITGHVFQGIGYVSVPLDSLGLNDADLAGLESHPTTEGPLYMTLPDALLSKVQQHLDTAYPGKDYHAEFVVG